MGIKTKIIVSASALIVVTLAWYFLWYKKINKKPKTIFLLGGLDYRSGDKNIDEQVALLKKGSNLEVKGFRYNNSKGLISAINESNKPMYIVLFSKGGQYSNEIAKAMKSKDYPLFYLYIVEPYAKSTNTSTSIKSAVELGVPNKNVIVGESSSVGKGVVNNTTDTPYCSPLHWCSLEMVGNILLTK